MIEHRDDTVTRAGFDVPVEPLRRAAHYTGEPGCIAEARAFAARFLERLRTEWCAAVDERAEGAVLLVVSELVTNADRHSSGPYILELEGTDDAVAVSVTDSSAALPLRFPRDPGRVGRHGLEIVHALAAEVTAERVPVGKRVRALLGLADDAQGTPGVRTTRPEPVPARIGMQASGSTEGGTPYPSPHGVAS